MESVPEQINLTALGNEQSRTKPLTLPTPTPKPSGSRMALVPLRTIPSSNVDRHRVIVRLPPANAYKTKAKFVVDAEIFQHARNTSTESGTIQEEQLSHRIDRLANNTVPKELP